MPQSDANSDATEAVARRPGRIRTAVAVLLGREPTPRSIHQEWIEYRDTFDGILRRLSAQLARQKRAEKRRIERELEQAEEAPAMQGTLAGRAAYKADLRARARMRGLGVVNGPHFHPSMAPPPPTAAVMGDDPEEDD